MFGNLGVACYSLSRYICHPLPPLIHKYKTHRCTHTCTYTQHSQVDLFYWRLEEKDGFNSVQMAIMAIHKALNLKNIIKENKRIWHSSTLTAQVVSAYGKG